MVASIIKRSPIKTLKGSEDLVKNDTEIILSLANKLHYVCVRQEMGICGVHASFEKGTSANPTNNIMVHLVNLLSISSVCGNREYAWKQR